MKRVFLNIRFLLIAMAVFSAALFVYQLRATNILKKEVLDKKADLQRIKSAGERSEEIKNELAENKHEEEAMLRKVPENKESIFILMRELTFTGGSLGIKDIKFVMNKASKENKNNITGGNIRNNMGGEMGYKEGKQKSSGAEHTAGAPSGLITYNLTISFSAGYREVYMFIKNILAMERIVLLESVEVKRDKTILPRQKVVLKLITYTFPDSKQ